MGIKKDKNSPPSQQPDTIREQIETIYEESVDTLDPDTADFLNDFLQRFNSTELLPEIDLTSPESARAAVEMLSKRKIEIDAMMRNAKALKSVIK